MARTRIKICGIRDEASLTAAAEAGADAVGFVFVESSPRYIRPEEAWKLADRARDAAPRCHALGTTDPRRREEAREARQTGAGR